MSGQFYKKRLLIGFSISKRKEDIISIEANNNCINFKHNDYGFHINRVSIYRYRLKWIRYESGKITEISIICGAQDEVEKKKLEIITKLNKIKGFNEMSIKERKMIIKRFKVRVNKGV